MGSGLMRVMTDVSAERYWTVVSETEVRSLEEYAEMSRKSMENPEFQADQAPLVRSGTVHRNAADLQPMPEAPSGGR